MTNSYFRFNRVREQRSELIKFSREVHRRFPSKHCEIKYDKLYVDSEVYVWDDKHQKIERISPSHHHSNPANISHSRVPQKYAKTLLEIDEADLQSRWVEKFVRVLDFIYRTFAIMA